MSEVKLDATHAYIGIDAKDMVQALVVDLRDDPKWVGQQVKELIRDGYRVERVTLEESRTLLHTKRPPL